MNDEKLKAERLKGLGASDSAAVLGVSTYASPLDIYAQKRGILVEPSDSLAEMMAWGNKLEPIIAAEYVQRTGRTIDLGRRYRVHQEHRWIFCHLDRLVSDKDRGQGVLEVKNAGSWRARDWAEEPPLQYQVQLQHQLMVTGLGWGSIGALIGGNRFIHYDLERNDAFIEILIQRLQKFWFENVLRGVPPLAGMNDSDAIRALFPRERPETTCHLTEEQFRIHEELRETKEQIKALEAKEKYFENTLKLAIGENETGLFPDGSFYTYRSINRKGYTVEPKTYRSLKFYERKNEYAPTESED